MANDKKKDEIRSKELRVVTSNPSRSKEGAGWKLRLVQYYKPATVSEGPKTVAIKLESGEYYLGDDKRERMSPKGLTLRDLEELLKIDGDGSGLRVIQNLVKVMKNPPAPPIEQTENPFEAPAPKTDISEVPFS